MKVNKELKNFKTEDNVEFNCYIINKNSFNSKDIKLFPEIDDNIIAFIVNNNVKITMSENKEVELTYIIKGKNYRKLVPFYVLTPVENSSVNLTDYLLQKNIESIRVSINALNRLKINKNYNLVGKQLYLTYNPYDFYSFLKKNNNYSFQTINCCNLNEEDVWSKNIDNIISFNSDHVIKSKKVSNVFKRNNINYHEELILTLKDFFESNSLKFPFCIALCGFSGASENSKYYSSFKSNLEDQKALRFMIQSMRNFKQEFSLNYKDKCLEKCHNGILLLEMLFCTISSHSSIKNVNSNYSSNLSSKSNSLYNSKKSNASNRIFNSVSPTNFKQNEKLYLTEQEEFSSDFCYNYLFNISLEMYFTKTNEVQYIDTKLNYFQQNSIDFSNLLYFYLDNDNKDNILNYNRSLLNRLLDGFGFNLKEKEMIANTFEMIKYLSELTIEKSSKFDSLTAIYDLIVKNFEFDKNFIGYNDFEKLFELNISQNQNLTEMKLKSVYELAFDLLYSLFAFVFKKIERAINEKHDSLIISKNRNSYTKILIINVFTKFYQLEDNLQNLEARNFHEYFYDQVAMKAYLKKHNINKPFLKLNMPEINIKNSQITSKIVEYSLKANINNNFAKLLNSSYLSDSKHYLSKNECIKQIFQLAKNYNNNSYFFFNFSECHIGESFSLNLFNKLINSSCLNLLFEKEKDKNGFFHEKLIDETFNRYRMICFSEKLLKVRNLNDLFVSLKIKSSLYEFSKENVKFKNELYYYLENLKSNFYNKVNIKKLYKVLYLIKGFYEKRKVFKLKLSAIIIKYHFFKYLKRKNKYKRNKNLTNESFKSDKKIKPEIKNIKENSEKMSNDSKQFIGKLLNRVSLKIESNLNENSNQSSKVQFLSDINNKLANSNQKERENLESMKNFDTKSFVSGILKKVKSDNLYHDVTNVKPKEIKKNMHITFTDSIFSKISKRQSEINVERKMDASSINNGSLNIKETSQNKFQYLPFEEIKSKMEELKIKPIFESFVDKIFDKIENKQTLNKKTYEKYGNINKATKNDIRESSDNNINNNNNNKAFFNNVTFDAKSFIKNVFKKVDQKQESDKTEKYLNKEVNIKTYVNNILNNACKKKFKNEALFNFKSIEIDVKSFVNKVLDMAIFKKLSTNKVNKQDNLKLYTEKKKDMTDIGNILENSFDLDNKAFQKDKRKIDSTITKLSKKRDSTEIVLNKNKKQINTNSEKRESVINYRRSLLEKQHKEISEVDENKYKKQDLIKGKVINSRKTITVEDTSKNFKKDVTNINDKAVFSTIEYMNKKIDEVPLESENKIIYEKKKLLRLEGNFNNSNISMLDSKNKIIENVNVNNQQKGNNSILKSIMLIQSFIKSSKLKYILSTLKNCTFKIQRNFRKFLIKKYNLPSNYYYNEKFMNKKLNDINILIKKERSILFPLENADEFTAYIKKKLYKLQLFINNQENDKQDLFIIKMQELSKNLNINYDLLQVFYSHLVELKFSNNSSIKPFCCIKYPKNSIQLKEKINFYTKIIDYERNSLDDYDFANQYKYLFDYNIDNNLYIKALSLGQKHCVAINNKGKVCSFGNNEVGQCGFSALSTLVNKEKFNSKSTKNSIKSTMNSINEIKLCNHTYENYSDNLFGLQNTSNLKYVGFDDIVHVIDLSCGDNHTLLLDNRSNLWGFGDNSNGQLGIGNCDEVELPTKIAGNFSEIKSNGNISFAVSLDGEFFMWPTMDKEGKLNYFPLYIPIDKEKIQTISCGGNFTFLLSYSGLLYSFGKSNTYGQLGHGDTKPRSKPKLVQTFFDFKIKIDQVSCGFKHVLVKSSAGKCYSWGLGSSGQLGLGDNNCSAIPQIINYFTRVFQITAGFNSSYFLTESRKIYKSGGSSNSSTPILLEINKIHPEITSENKISIVKIEAVWNKSISFLNCVLSDYKSVKTNDCFKINQIMNELSKKWTKKINYIPNVESLNNYK